MKKKLIFALLFLAFFVMCSSPPPPPASDAINFVKLKKAVEDSTDDFNPARLLSGRHVALVYQIQNGNVMDSLDTASLKRRIGPMPQLRSAENFQVMFTRDSGHGMVRELFYMANPLYYRVEAGPSPGEKRIRNGYFEVPLPYDNNIIGVVLIDGRDTLVRSDVRALFNTL
jgi:hypothetical protein